nr:uncharacterized protein CTRU02_00890 [Colletotrichum truncatum]KAF6800485.1 hypothetical protein CTRU02_00890 [Colletotrichum truncatum]
MRSRPVCLIAHCKNECVKPFPVIPIREGNNWFPRSSPTSGLFWAPFTHIHHYCLAQTCHQPQPAPLSSSSAGLVDGPVQGSTCWMSACRAHHSKKELFGERGSAAFGGVIQVSLIDADVLH